ncbi:hypothetical protein niasHT_006203 [Heterodera trifolii]|uniref:RING-type domain-containing protein n=1 Tax=Heterodera trifolii TaxID=157864 RepID=A0ABD2M2F4_9BILA
MMTVEEEEGEDVHELIWIGLASGEVPLNKVPGQMLNCYSFGAGGDFYGHMQMYEHYDSSMRFAVGDVHYAGLPYYVPPFNPSVPPPGSGQTGVPVQRVVLVPPAYQTMPIAGNVAGLHSYIGSSSNGGGGGGGGGGNGGGGGGVGENNNSFMHNAPVAYAMSQSRQSEARNHNVMMPNESLNADGTTRTAFLQQSWPLNSRISLTLRLMEVELLSATNTSGGRERYAVCNALLTNSEQARVLVVAWRNRAQPAEQVFLVGGAGSMFRLTNLVWRGTRERLTANYTVAVGFGSSIELLQPPAPNMYSQLHLPTPAVSEALPVQIQPNPVLHLAQNSNNDAELMQSIMNELLNDNNSDGNATNPPAITQAQPGHHQQQQQHHQPNVQLGHIPTTIGLVVNLQQQQQQQSLVGAEIQQGQSEEPPPGPMTSRHQNQRREPTHGSTIAAAAVAASVEETNTNQPVVRRRRNNNNNSGRGTTNRENPVELGALPTVRRNQSGANRTQPIRTQVRRRRRRESTPTFEIGGGLTGQQCDSILPNLEVNQQMLQNDERCVVCQIGFTLGSLNATELPCQHFYHLTCAREWLMRRNRCAVCMRSFVIDPTNNSLLVVLDNEFSNDEGE